MRPLRRPSSLFVGPGTLLVGAGLLLGGAGLGFVGAAQRFGGPGLGLLCPDLGLLGAGSGFVGAGSLARRAGRLLVASRPFHHDPAVGVLAGADDQTGRATHRQLVLAVGERDAQCSTGLAKGVCQDNLTGHEAGSIDRLGDRIEQVDLPDPEFQHGMDPAVDLVRGVRRREDLYADRRDGIIRAGGVDAEVFAALARDDHKVRRSAGPRVHRVPTDVSRDQRIGTGQHVTDRPVQKEPPLGMQRGLHHRVLRSPRNELVVDRRIGRSGNHGHIVPPASNVVRPSSSTGGMTVRLRRRSPAPPAGSSGDAVQIASESISHGFRGLTTRNRKSSG